MLQDFFLKAMLKRHGVPAGEVDKVVALVNKNPELFKTIAEEAQAKIKSGVKQEEAMMQVMLAHKDELEKLKN
jgi:hypothetical protein